MFLFVNNLNDRHLLSLEMIIRNVPIQGKINCRFKYLASRSIKIIEKKIIKRPKLNNKFDLKIFSTLYFFSISNSAATEPKSNSQALKGSK